jgi:TolB-like protein/DNA-binding winged helix-turn-helix (wHTH) protein/Flp pilus assembly protein TadD
MTSAKLRFRDYELDPDGFELCHTGHRIRLERKPMELLILLAQKRGHLVGREEIIEEIWGKDFFFDAENGINNAVRKIRSALNDDAERPRFVETAVGKGYRFIAPVEPVLEPGGSATPEPDALFQEPQWFRWRRVWIPAVAAAALFAGALVFDAAGIRNRIFGLGPPIHSIAVLPLENLSGDPTQDYFADGITDELITTLAKINSVDVISRTSVMRYKGVHKPLPQIARELGADGVVEGTVTHSGDRVRINAQLIYAPADRHLWAERYERNSGDILLLENDLARAIAEQIRGRLTPEEQRRFTARPIDPAAHEAYLQGLYLWNKRTEPALRQSARYFQQAIGKVPLDAKAYAGLANAYIVLGSWSVEAISPREALEKARTSAEKALQLDARLAEGHTALAAIKHIYEWDWEGAGTEFRRAIELNPSYAPAHQWYAQYLCELGRFEECIPEATRAHALDPAYLIAGADVGIRLYWARRYREAIAPIQKILEFDPDFGIAHRFLGQVYEENHMYKEAVAELRKAVELSRDGPIDLAALGHAYAVAGRQTAALNILKELKQLEKRRYVSNYDIALVHVGLGQRDRALESLDRAYQERSSWMVHLKVDPRLDPLRSDPRFQNLLRRVGLP